MLLMICVTELIMTITYYIILSKGLLLRYMLSIHVFFVYQKKNDLNNLSLILIHAKKNLLLSLSFIQDLLVQKNVYILHSHVCGQSMTTTISLSNIFLLNISNCTKNKYRFSSTHLFITLFNDRT